MKITVFQAGKGDCILIRGQGGKAILADGGLKGSYQNHVRRTLGELAKIDEAIELVYVSHIDQDHIGGVLQLMDDAVDWRVYDFQQSTGNSGFPKPNYPRPPDMKVIWHNAFKDQVGDNSAAIEDQLVANSRYLNMRNLLTGDEQVIHEEMAETCTDLATSIREGLQLSNRVSKNQLNIPVNPEFGGGLIFADEAPEKTSIGGLDLYIIGPFKTDLEALREKWNAWLEENQAIIEEIRAEADEDAANLPMDEGQLLLSNMLSLAAKLGDRGRVTVPNLASLMLLIEENGKSLLMTGDGHADEILKGLAIQNKLDPQDRMHVDVLKVQHHGSEHNIDEDFCKAITADHYILCGNGAHENPNLDVLQLIIDKRLAVDDDAKFKFWFNSSVKYAGTTHREEHMQQVKKLVDTAARRSNRRLRYRFLTRGSKIEFTL
jgi:beta-lactamase superfamily II metal-dependent hydrolase